MQRIMLLARWSQRQFIFSLDSAIMVFRIFMIRETAPRRHMLDSKASAKIYAR